LLYHVRPDFSVSDDEADAFGLLNVPLNAWPYWRELCQSLALRLDVPPVPLALLHGERVASLVIDEAEVID
jgi:hypothetical protein